MQLGLHDVDLGSHCQVQVSTSIRASSCQKGVTNRSQIMPSIDPEISWESTEAPGNKQPWSTRIFTHAFTAFCVTSAARVGHAKNKVGLCHPLTICPSTRACCLSPCLSPSLPLVPRSSSYSLHRFMSTLDSCRRCTLGMLENPCCRAVSAPFVPAWLPYAVLRSGARLFLDKHHESASHSECHRVLHQTHRCDAVAAFALGRSWLLRFGCGGWGGRFTLWAM